MLDPELSDMLNYLWEGLQVINSIRLQICFGLLEDGSHDKHYPLNNCVLTLLCKHVSTTTLAFSSKQHCAEVEPHGAARAVESSGSDIQECESSQRY